MSETTVPTPGQAEGTAPGSAPVPPLPVTPGSEGTEAAGQEGAKEGYLTREEAKALEERVLNQARSYSDKGRVRVENAVKDVTNAIATFRQTGQQITPEQEKAMKDAAIQKAMTEPEPAPAGDQPPQAAPQGQIDPEVLAIQTEMGVALAEGDPELAQVDRAHGIRKFYSSVTAACEAKKTRLASQPIEPAGTAASRLPPAGSAATVVAKNAQQYWDKAYKKG